MLRSVWVDFGDNPDPVKCARYGITRPLFDLRDTDHATLANAKQWLGRPFTSVGVYVCANWHPEWTGSPSSLAKWVDEQLAQRFPGTGSGLPHVSFNVEAQWVVGYNGGIPTYCGDLFAAWRSRRATRATTLVIDGFQGGWWQSRQSDVDDILAADLEELQVEAYGAVHSNPPGPTLMDRFDTKAVCLDMEQHGFERVVPMHDAMALGIGWYGAAYTQGRLV